MITEQAPSSSRFDVRFGEPDSQVVVLRMTSDLAALLAAAADGDLRTVAAPTFADESSVLVVAASEGYPVSPRTGDVIEGAAEAAAVPGVTVLCAGVGRDDNGNLVTAGGRVINVVGHGADAAIARARATKQSGTSTGRACTTAPTSPPPPDPPAARRAPAPFAVARLFLVWVLHRSGGVLPPRRVKTDEDG